MNDIPSDERQYKKLAEMVTLRHLRGLDHDSEDRLKWERMERWWDQVEADGNQNREGAVRLGYAFGMVERMHAKITEPLFQMGLPAAIHNKDPRDSKAAKNAEHVAYDWYVDPDNQEPLSKSKKSMCIVGHRWEWHGWKHIVQKGKAWGMVPRQVEVVLRKDGTPDSEASQKKAKTVVLVPDEVPVDRLVHYGFDTEYPDWRDVYPEPFRSSIDTGKRTDLAWVIRDHGYVALEDLAREMRTDPTTKAQVPVYDFSRLLKDAGKSAQKRYEKIMRGESPDADPFAPVIRPVRDLNAPSNWRRGLAGGQESTEAQALEDRDKIWLREHREPGRIVFTAQGKYLVLVINVPWHVPGLKVSIENYSSVPNRLRGKGAIEPLEAELGQLDDIHELGMQNIFRLVNKMLYIREDAIVNEDDFDPRAGGRIRIRTDQADVRSAVADASQVSPVNEMISVESELKGLIEYVSMELDGSPGVLGTKAEHKTARGQAQIVNNMAPSFARWQRQARFNECRRMRYMVEFFSQFAFIPMPYRLMTSDGGVQYAQLTKDDIDTQGRGFNFTFDMDPLWGNIDQKRMLKREMFQDGVEYMKIPKSIRGANSRDVNLDEIYEDYLRWSGYGDVSSIFRKSDGEMSPDEEMMMVMRGATQVRCRGNLMDHVSTHILQSRSPWLAKAIEAGKAHPETAKRLLLLAETAVNEMASFVRDPAAAAHQRLGEAGMVAPPSSMNGIPAGGGQ